MNKSIIIYALGVMAMASCADRFDQNFETVAPEKSAAYAYLNAYAPLKEYVADKPYFHLGVGTTVSQYLDHGLVYALTNSNFNETVAGNAMKMASCVSDDGTMDFTSVTDYVNDATDAGLSVYGHTLAWHSQQPLKWLNSLLADKTVEVDPDAKVENVVYEYDYAGKTAYPFYSMYNKQEKVEDGALVIENATEGLANWQVQYFVGDQAPVTKGEDYVLRVTIKGSADGALNCNIGDWSATSSCNVNFTSDWETVDVNVTAVPASPAFIVFQSGSFVGTIYVKKVQLIKVEDPKIQIPVDVVKYDYEDGVAPSGWGNSSTRQVVSGSHDGSQCAKITNPSAVNSWECQVAIDFDAALDEGQVYYLHFWGKASAAGTVGAAYQDPSTYAGRGDYPNFDLTTDWTEYTLKTSITGSNCKRLCFNLGKLGGDIYLDDVEIYYMKDANGIPLTDEEKKDTLTWAMNKWIGGMMEACQGKVKAWDVVNEALSGADTDGDGWYDLQHTSNVSATDAASNFYWQDYLGDLDYVRTAVKAAREQFAANGGEATELKLFVNDYNLESDWDDNKKLKSLIHWIEQWEADGTTQIDGIGTQMHISCYMDEATQERKKQHIEQMLTLMAASGKLVRISELDMGLVDAEGNSVLTANMTEEQHKAMAALYTWIVKKYIEIVPQAQQWGVCQWCPTDSPTGSSWRAGMPTGLWDADYYRKHTYGGFADGLKQQ